MKECVKELVAYNSIKKVRKVSQQQLIMNDQVGSILKY